MATWKKVVVSGSAISQLDNDANYITAASLPTVNNSTITVQTGSVADSTSFTLNQATNASINVFSGEYSDLSGAPSIPTVNNNRITLETGSAGELAASPDFTLNQSSDETIKVFSGQYSDLAGAPTIPTVNNSTITVQTGSVADSTSFTLNQATNASINVFSGQYSDLSGAPADFIQSVADTANQTGITLTVDGNGQLTAAANGLETSDNVQFANLTVSGDLEVAGTASFKHASNLNVADQYISMNSGSAGAGNDSGGIVILQDGNTGDLFGWSDEAASATGGQRWGVKSSFNPSSTGDFSPDAYMAAVLKGQDGVNSAADILAIDSTYNRKGNIYVASNAQDIWIYS